MMQEWILFIQHISIPLKYIFYIIYMLFIYVFYLFALFWVPCRPLNIFQTAF